MGDLSDAVTNSELVTSVLGQWPSFHDAEVVRIELSREPAVTAKLTVITMPYNPSGAVLKSLLTFLFRDVENVEIEAFNHQNVLWDLTVEVVDGAKRLEISSSFGLGGSLTFGEAEVLEARRLD